MIWENFSDCRNRFHLKFLPDQVCLVFSFVNPKKKKVIELGDDDVVVYFKYYDPEEESLR